MNAEISSPFGRDVAFAVVTHSTPYRLKNEELSALSEHVAAKRREQFRLGRAAAHAAFEKIGLCPAPPILRGKRGEPIWPPEIVGTISHSDSLGVCALAKAKEYLSLGVDIQSTVQNKPLTKGILKRIADETEKAWVLQAGSDWQQRALLLFSAKESIFKALYPLIKQEIGFKKAVLIWSESEQLFDAALAFELPGLKQYSNFKVAATFSADAIVTGLALRVS